jgi:SAM-dependent methyltransferase
LRGQSNVHVEVGEEGNPRLPTGTADAVLICNTYHEFSNPELMLNQLFWSLRRGGHLVVVDRAPRPTEAEHAHEMPLTAVEGELRQKGFEIVSQDDHFIDRPGNDSWWLLNAQKP